VVAIGESRVLEGSQPCLAGVASRSRDFRADETAQEVSMNQLHVVLLLSTAAALSISEPASAQQRADHLIVYKVRTAPRLPVTYTMDLEAVEADLSALGCVLKAGTRAKQLLVPVDKRNVSPEPPAPQIGGQALAGDYLCYKVDCRTADVTAGRERKNQFLDHEVSKMRVRRVCVPTGTAPTCVADGESCAAGETCCEGLMCCAGIPVPPGQEFCGAICPISDRDAKENFATVDSTDVLRKLADLEISTWSYKSERDGARHLGPMAQDFRATFGLGASDRSIFLVDADGVALTAIQALNTELESVREENRGLRRSIGSLESRLQAIEAR